LIESPEPKGKLDAMTTMKAIPVARVGVVNGPEGESWEWRTVNWRQTENDVRRLRQRIFAASQAGDLKRVRSLQKLMLRSRSNALLSVRRVTEINAGRATAGVDGQTVLFDEQKVELVEWMQHRSASWTPLPVKRVFVPKSNGKKRGLGIPVIVDRALQARVVNALEPEWEARFEPKSYGFRPGRSCQDAIAAIFWTMAGTRTKRRWVLDADLAAAFDRADHAHILDQLGTFPARDDVAAWLRAGVIDQGRFAPTEQGTPQGGVISPLIFNVALHGIAEAGGAAFYRNPYRDSEAAVPGTPVLVVYADDLVALCESREQADEVKTRLTPWLASRGLAFNEDKTRVVHLDEGFNFLGFNVRRYGNKLLIKPSTEAVRRLRRRLSALMRALRGSNAQAVLRAINPIVRGWSAYYRGVVSTETFQSLDRHLWNLTYKWACHSHNGKPKHWITSRYFGRFHPNRQDQWVFGDRDTGGYLLKFSWTTIVRHNLVKGRASPDDPVLAEYWAKRRRRSGPEPPMDRVGQRLLTKQHGRCGLCGGFLLHADHQPTSPEEWERWLKATRKAIIKHAIALTGSDPPDDTEPRLIHTHCQSRIPTGRPALLPTGAPSGPA
jgi:RNA-directed DNA polymerase